MGFTLRFIILFIGILIIVSPVLLFLAAVIATAALQVRKSENWTFFNTVYFAFVTATTVGYGDYRPKSKRGRVFSMLIALTGLIMTGIMVSVAMQAVARAFEFTASNTRYIEVWQFTMNYF